MSRALAVTGLRAGYGRLPVLHGIDLRVEHGEVLAVLGRNGVGKTTLAKAVMGLLPTNDGQVQVLGNDVTQWNAHKRARLGVAYAPQELPIFDELTVEQNLTLAVRDRSRGGVAKAAAFEAFPVLGHRLAQSAGTLSGGERKMLLMARALVQNAHLLVLDEVTEGVQPGIVNTIGDTVRREVARGCAVLLIEQRLDFALGLADRFVVMHAGEVASRGTVTEGTADEVARHMVLR